MRRIATILLIWPLIVFGESDLDALPPWGIWECEFEAAFECDWKNTANYQSVS